MKTLVRFTVNLQHPRCYEAMVEHVNHVTSELVKEAMKSEKNSGSLLVDEIIAGHWILEDFSDQTEDN